MRPLVHFTPERNFMNDPNGLVFHEGEYHLFYQHNPFGDVWGHMSWGHAISRDLLHWQHLPVALAEENGVMVFSGCAVVDRENTSGFGKDGKPPLVAIFTGHTEQEQTQNIAWSNDNGRTWTKYPGNPVIAIGSRDHRDPKVIWHAPTRRWIMITVLADIHQVRIDGSPDLIHWEHLSDYGPFGAADGVWECPDLFPLAIEGQPGNDVWVIKVDVCRTTGAQFIVGDFDGRVFTPREDAQAWRIDHGVDFYAAQSWSDALDGRRIWVAWMANWAYANTTPSSPWRGSFSIPRVVSLRPTPEGLRLRQQPIAELAGARAAHLQAGACEVAEANDALAGLEPAKALEVSLRASPGRARRFGITVSHGEGEETVINCDLQALTLTVDRRRSGEHAFADTFAAEHVAPLAPVQGAIDLHVFLDGCSVEVFAQDGLVVLSDLIFPHSGLHSVSLFEEGGVVTVERLDVWPLDPRVKGGDIALA